MAALNPGAFAFVMATGIVSTALDHDGTRPVSAALLVVGLAGYAALAIAYGRRLVSWRSRCWADLIGPRAFGFLTFVAASDVLAARLAADHRTASAGGFLAAGAAGWLLLGYGIPLVLITSARRRPALEQVNGIWFNWAVGTQSVAVAAAKLGPLVGTVPLGVAAAACWGGAAAPAPEGRGAAAIGRRGRVLRTGRSAAG